MGNNLVVNNAGDRPIQSFDENDLTLREAIYYSASDPDNTVTFIPGLIEITLTEGEIVVDKDLIIGGGGVVTVKKSAAANPARIFNVSANTKVKITSMIIRDGYVESGGGSSYEFQ